MGAGRNLRPADVRKETDTLGHENFLRATFGVRLTHRRNATTGLRVRFCRRVKGESLMDRYVKRFGFPRAAATLSLVVGLISIAAFPLLATNKPFSVPDDIAVRIRLDDTLTSTDSQIGDPSARRSSTKAITRTLESTATLRKSTCPEKSKAIPA